VRFKLRNGFRDTLTFLSCVKVLGRQDEAVSLGGPLAGASARRNSSRIHRHAVEWYCGRTSKAKFNPSRDRLVGLSAIGKSLRDQYDTLSPPIPPRLATLVERLETKK
jgi:hypothetical protein